MLVVVALLAWGIFGVAPRARLDPARPETHMTDFTVFTTAATALHEGRDPYTAVSPRGWPYLYPPLFALLVSPLRDFDPPLQVFIWFLLNVVLAYGCLFECRRLGLVFWKAHLEYSSRQAAEPPAWIGILAFLAALLPMLDCLQAGQVGHAVLYPLLLGLRLVLLGVSWPGICLGGVLLALPVAIKLTPMLPVGFLVLLLICWAPRWKAVQSMLGIGFGSVFWWLIIPATLLGWQPNYQHLQHWYEHVVRAEDIGDSRGINTLSTRNQCLGSALYRAANDWPTTAAAGPTNDGYGRVIEPFPPHGREGWAKPITIARVLILLLLLAAGLCLAGGGDLLGISATLGLACVAALLISPISWGHHYVQLLPGTLFITAWFHMRGFVKLSVLLAIIPVSLSLLHYIALPYAGRFGLLAFGMTGWLLLACLLSLVGCAKHNQRISRRGD